MAKKISNILKQISKPLFFVLTGIAILGLLVQIFFPDLYFSNQEVLRAKVDSYRPYDVWAFILLQIFQVIVAPVSHYAVSILGGALYGAHMGGIYNWVGRMIGHIIAYWFGRIFGRKLFLFFFDENDFKQYEKFINGTKKTLYIRLIILFLMIFLPIFPDDEISYLVGIASLNFSYYLIILLVGHIGGSFALAYLGAGINEKDPFFAVLVGFGVLFAILLIYYVKKLGKVSEIENEPNQKKIQ